MSTPCSVPPVGIPASVEPVSSVSLAASPSSGVPAALASAAFGSPAARALSVASSARSSATTRLASGAMTVAGGISTGAAACGPAGAAGATSAWALGCATGSCARRTSTAPTPTIAAAARPAAALEATVLMPAPTAPPAPAPAAPPAAAAPPAPAVVPRWASRTFLKSRSGRDRHERGQRLVGLLELLAEVAAAVAGAQVAADRGGGAPQALGDLAELLADLLAGQQPRLGHLGQRHARAHEERLDRRDRGLHRLGDLLVAQRVDLAQQQRGLLRLRQLLHVADERAELLALVDLVGRRLAALGEVDVHRVDADRLLAAQMVQRAVARDPVQPRPHVDRPLVAEDRVERGGEDLLQDVLGVLARAEHVPAEREQAGLVARDQRLEGRMVALADERDEALVRLQAQQRRGPTEGRWLS